MIKVLVTGSNGQLGNCLQNIAEDYPEIAFTFKSSKALDITCKTSISKTLSADFDYCINCAAYTAVDKAELEPESADKINHIAVKHLAEVCEKNDVVLIHISTDFVFDGQKTSPYTEKDQPKPSSIYGSTKHLGEQAIQNTLSSYFIMRTSWLYAECGSNFVKTMLRLAKDRTHISVVDDQIGSPTYAGDLANVILKLIQSGIDKYGIYHFSNHGAVSWYEFAKAIFNYSNVKINLKAIPTTRYPTPAKRPKYSVLDNTKINNHLNITPIDWRLRLKKLIDTL